MFDDIALLQVAAFGRPDFLLRRPGQPDAAFVGIFVPQHVEVSLDGSGNHLETTMEAVSVTTATANSMAVAKGDAIVLPHAPGAPRRVAVRRDNGYSMTLLILRGA